MRFKKVCWSVAKYSISSLLELYTKCLARNVGVLRWRRVGDWDVRVLRTKNSCFVWMYWIIHVDESYIILIKHSVTTKCQSDNRSLWNLKFPQKHSKPICPLETSNWTDFETPKPLPNWPLVTYNSKTCSLWAPKWASKWYKIDKADSDFGLRMTFPVHQIL